MYSIRWELGLIFQWRGERWTVIAADRSQKDSANPFVVRVQNMTDHHILTVRIADLATWMERREVTIEHRPGLRRKTRGGEALAVSEKYWKQALDRLDVIRPLLSRPAVTDAEVCRIAASRGVTSRTIWNWISAYRGGGIDALIPARGFGMASEPRWKDLRVAEICNRALEDHYLKLWAPSKIHVIRCIQDECAAAGVSAPHRATLYRIIGRVPAAIAVQKREGQRNSSLSSSPRLGTSPRLTSLTRCR